MKKGIALFVSCCCALGLTACGAPAANDGDLHDATGVSYVYEYQGMVGMEEAQFDLHEDGSCKFYLPDHPVIQDAYIGTYTRDGDTVTITDLVNEDPAAEHANPGLWEWIVDGGTVITVDDASGTFVPAQDGANAAGGQDAQGLNGVAYATTSPSQVCDIYQPEGVEKAPVILLVHGGGFLFGDTKMPVIQPVISAALERGYAVVSVDYRKSSEAVFPGALADVKAAVRFVKANAQEYGFDPEHIVLWGESAGAYLSLMTALTPDVEQLNGDVTDYADISSQVQGFVSFYAPVEFYTLYEEAGTPEAAADSFESKFLGSDITADEKLTYTTYWETYVDQMPHDVMAWIQVGDSDQKVPTSQSVNFAQRLSGYLPEGNVAHSVIAGADHEDELFYTQENLSAVLDWLDGFMKG